MRKLAQLLAGVLWVASCGAGGMAAAEEDDVKAVLQAYEAAWSRHDADAVAAFYYEPAMRVSRSGPAVRATRAEQRAFFEGFLRGLVERGYAKSEWEELDVRLLDSQTALASGITVR